MSFKTELLIYAAILALIWIGCNLMLEPDAMAKCQQDHSHDTCFTELYE